MSDTLIDLAYLGYAVLEKRARDTAKRARVAARRAEEAEARSREAYAAIRRAEGMPPLAPVAK
jgi:hypothetical protein